MIVTIGNPKGRNGKTTLVRAPSGTSAHAGDEHAGEQVRRANQSCDPRSTLLSGIVHKDLVAGGVILAHRRRQALLETAKQFAGAVDMFGIRYQPIL